MIFHCPFCGLKARPGASDCSNCGGRMTRECPHCSEAVASNEPVCKYCDGELAPPPLPGSSGIRYLPDSPPPPRTRKLFMALGIAAVAAAPFLLRTDCMRCELAAPVAASCGRAECSDRKTPLWKTISDSVKLFGPAGDAACW